jgi:NMD protein affecting ribosome stability and mRNA decay
MFCPRCGKEKGTFIKGFCLDCYLKGHELAQLPSLMQIEHCKKCGKIRFKGKWLSQSEELLKDFVRFNIKPKELKDFEVQASL